MEFLFGFIRRQDIPLSFMFISASFDDFTNLRHAYAGICRSGRPERRARRNMTPYLLGSRFVHAPNPPVHLPNDIIELVQFLGHPFGAGKPISPTVDVFHVGRPPMEEETVILVIDCPGKVFKIGRLGSIRRVDVFYQTERANQKLTDSPIPISRQMDFIGGQFFLGRRFEHLA